MPTLKTTGVTVPSAFPARAYHSIDSHVSVGLQGTGAARKFAGAWNGLSYRYAEVIDAERHFRRLTNRYGAAPKPRHRSIQERALFDFFGASISVFECCAFATYAIASHKHGGAFPLTTDKDERRVSPNALLKKLKRKFSGEVVTAQWAFLLADPRYQALHDLRNVLTHRVTFARHHHVGGAMDGTALWGDTGEILHADLLTGRAANVGQLLTVLLPSIDTFARRHC